MKRLRWGAESGPDIIGIAVAVLHGVYADYQVVPAF